MASLLASIVAHGVGTVKGVFMASWLKKQYVKPERKVLRHARVSFAVVRCIDCQRVLPVTHMLQVYGERCRSCYLLYGASQVVGVPTHS